MPDDNTPIDTENYWHSIRPKSYLKGLHLHWDRDLQLKEMDQYVRSEDDLARIIKLDTKIVHGSLALGIVLSLVGAVLLVLCGRSFSVILLIFGLVFLIVGPIAAYFLYQSRLFHRRRTLKYSLVIRAIERYFHPEVYLAQKKLPAEFINEASLVENWKKAEVSDYFAGIWNSLPFQFGDLTITGEDPKSHQDTVLFSGQIFILELTKQIPVPILIRERAELLTPEMHEARKNSDRFFMTGNDQFDRQFALSFGEDKRASGFEETGDSSMDEVRAKVHEVIDSMVQDILDADTFASSRTSIRLINKRVYLAIENSRDTFELMPQDEQNLDLDLLKKRFEEEAEHITTYLDLMTRNGEIFKHPATPSETAVELESEPESKPEPAAESEPEQKSEPAAESEPEQKSEPAAESEHESE